jgi:hypothetical protein
MLPWRGTGYQLAVVRGRPIRFALFALAVTILLVAAVATAAS